MERAGMAEDLAGTAIFLASSASDYVTGQVVFIDGGSMAGSFSDKKSVKKAVLLQEGG